MHHRTLPALALILCGSTAFAQSDDPFADDPASFWTRPRYETPGESPTPQVRPPYETQPGVPDIQRPLDVVPTVRTPAVAPGLDGSEIQPAMTGEPVPSVTTSESEPVRETTFQPVDKTPVTDPTTQQSLGDLKPTGTFVAPRVVHAIDPAVHRRMVTREREYAAARQARMAARKRLTRPSLRPTVKTTLSLNEGLNALGPQYVTPAD